MKDTQLEITQRVERAYQVFARYPGGMPPSDCTYCYSEEQLEHYRTTPLRELDDEATRVLVWESSDHWLDVATYKHYLPRILERLASDPRCGLFHAHLPQVLAQLGFATWSEAERVCLEQFLDAYQRLLSEEEFTDPDWVVARRALHEKKPEP